MADLVMEFPEISLDDIEARAQQRNLGAQTGVSLLPEL